MLGEIRLGLDIYLGRLDEVRLGLHIFFGGLGEVRLGLRIYLEGLGEVRLGLHMSLRVRNEELRQASYACQLEGDKQAECNGMPRLQCTNL